MSEVKKPKRARRTLKSAVIEPFKQIKIGLYVIGITLIFLMLLGIMTFFAFKEQYQQVMEIFNVTGPSEQWALILNDVFYSNAIKLALLFVLFIGVLFAVIFNMTHRIYGPLVSVERFVEDITNGRYERRIIIRRKDELQRLAEKLNIMAEKLQQLHGVPNDRRANRG